MNNTSEAWALMKYVNEIIDFVKVVKGMGYILIDW